ncbi:MAG: hypothetical protein AAFY07_04145 [Pseudomonadota bacterium]
MQTGISASPRRGESNKMRLYLAGNKQMAGWPPHPLQNPRSLLKLLYNNNIGITRNTLSSILKNTFGIGQF